MELVYIYFRLFILYAQRVILGLDQKFKNNYSTEDVSNDDKIMFWKVLKSTKYGSDRCVVIGVDLEPSDVDTIIHGNKQFFNYQSNNLQGLQEVMKTIWCVR